MGWRVVVITQTCKLEYKLNYLVMRGETTTKVFLPEIGTIIIESTAVSLTAVLLCEIVKQKINLIFCDEKHNPFSQLLPLSGCHDSARKVLEQMQWDPNQKTLVWTKIVQGKIVYQSQLLKRLGLSSYEMLQNYANNVAFGDATNREGHAAKVYFNALFGKDFSRSQDNNINSILNYGYTILLSAFTREIAANGYLTMLGLNHKNPFNQFNFACDLMEPFRILIDEFCMNHFNESLTTELKHNIVNILNQYVKIDGSKQTVSNAISIYCKSIFEGLNQVKGFKIKWYEL